MCLTMFFFPKMPAFESENDEDPLEHLGAYLKIELGMW